MTESELRQAISRGRTIITRARRHLAKIHTWQGVAAHNPTLKGMEAEIAEMLEGVEATYDALRLAALDRGMALPRWPGDDYRAP